MSYDEGLAKQCLEWVQDITGDRSFSTSGNKANLQAVLKDGLVLCRLMNCLRPGSISEKNLKKAPKMPFQQMELIGMFLEKVPAYGIPDREKFQTVDLFEGTNLKQVVQCLLSMARQAKGEGKAGFL